MTAFDVVALLVFAVSALVGYSRGAVREVVMFTALALAALVSVAVLPFTAGLLSHLAHPRWIASAAAVIVVFVIVYVGVRMVGGAASTHLRQSSLGALDRWLGAGVGAIRALVLLGLASLVLAAAPWPSGSPAWLTRAWTWPVARASGHLVARLAPAGGSVIGGVGKFMGAGIVKGFAPSDEPAAESAGSGSLADGETNGDLSANATDERRTLQVRSAGESRRRHGRGEASSHRHSAETMEGAQ